MNDNQQQNVLLKKVAKGSVITFSGFVVGKSLFFCIQLMIVHLFGARYFGLFVAGITVVEFSRIAASLGLPKGGMRFLSLALGSNTVDKLYGILGTTLFIPAATSTVTGIALFFFSSEIALLWFKDPQLIPIIRLFAFSLPFSALVGAGVDLSKGFNTTVFSALTDNIIVPVSRIAVFIIFYGFGYGFHSILYAVIASSGFSAMFILAILVKQTKEKTGRPFNIKDFIKQWYSSRDKRAIVTYSFPLFLTGFCWIVIRSTDVMMVGYFLDPGDIGIYAAAAVIATLLTTFLLRSLESILAPLIATQHGSNNSDNIRYLYLSTTRWMFFITLPIVIFIMIAAEQIMWIYGKDFAAQGSMVLLILIIGQMVDCVTGGVGNILTMTGHQKKELATNSVAVGLNIVLNLCLIPVLGIIGAAIATSSSLIIINVIRILIVYHLFKFQPFTRRMVRLFSMAVTIAVLSLWLKSCFPMNFIMTALLAAVSAGLMIGLVFLIGFSREDRELFNKLIVKFFPAGKPG